MKTESLPLSPLRLATRQSHQYGPLRQNEGEETIHVCQHVFAEESDGENGSGGRNALVAKFFCLAYLSKFCVLMLKMWGRGVFRR